MDNLIAKNLLSDNTCDNCEKLDIEFDSKKYCKLKNIIPVENTCIKWQAASTWPLDQLLRAVNLASLNE